MRHSISLFFSLLFIHSADAQRVADITAPAGFSRQPCAATSFDAWLRALSLKSDRTVYLYDGRRKPNQTAQYAVIDISVGDKDLQQCADAVMRLYAEYCFAQRRYDRIVFRSVSGFPMDYAGWREGWRFPLKDGRLLRTRSGAPDTTRAGFLQYLERVFSFAGTLSLEKQLSPVREVRAGDVFIRGGSPGHAVIVVDVATDKSGRKKYLLAQSYMPAQDIHILRNPFHLDSPWYDTLPTETLETPEWSFAPNSLRRFP
ncbi:DUF4846 domain-containing protein [Chitinophaga lutea]